MFSKRRVKGSEHILSFQSRLLFEGVGVQKSKEEVIPVIFLVKYGGKST